MDDRQFLVSRINQRLEAAKVAIELQARRHLSILAVALTLGGGAAVASVSGQLGTWSGGPVSAVGAAVVVAQLRALSRLGRDWDREVATADAGMETLMPSEEETLP